MVIGVADGYTDVWYGGYVGDSGVPGSDDAALPDSPLITLVSGSPGQTISNVDLVFGQVGPVTVTIVIDGVSTVIPVAPDGTVVLPTPTKAGFTFVGWFTDLNDPDSQFSASTPVTSDLTLYATVGVKVRPGTPLLHVDRSVTDSQRRCSSRPEHEGSFVAVMGGFAKPPITAQKNRPLVFPRGFRLAPPGGPRLGGCIGGGRRLRRPGRIGRG